MRCYDKIRNVHVKKMQAWIFGRLRDIRINRLFGVQLPANEVKVGVKVNTRKLAKFGTKSCVGRWTIRIGTCVRACVRACVFNCEQASLSALTCLLMCGLLRPYISWEEFTYNFNNTGGKEFHVGLRHATCHWRVSQLEK